MANVEDIQRARKARANAYARLFHSELGRKVLALMIQDSGIWCDDDSVRPTTEYECAVARGRAEFMSSILRSCVDGGMKVKALGGLEWMTGETTSPKESSGPTSTDSTTSGGS